MKYDDASWHYGGTFPQDLPPESGATHTGMFVAWALLPGFAGEIHIVDFPETIPKLRSRSLTPGKFFLDECDGKFIDEDLNEEGNAFALDYFDDFEKCQFLKDYDAILGSGLESLYYVKDSWENFDLLKPVLDVRLSDWRARRSAR
jgi:hypothetical protein